MAEVFQSNSTLQTFFFFFFPPLEEARCFTCLAVVESSLELFLMTSLYGISEVLFFCSAPDKRIQSWQRKAAGNCLGFNGFPSPFFS